MMLGSMVAGRHDPQQKLRACLLSTHEAERERKPEIETERHTERGALTRNDRDF